MGRICVDGFIARDLMSFVRTWVESYLEASSDLLFCVTLNPVGCAIRVLVGTRRTFMCRTEILDWNLCSFRLLTSDEIRPFVEGAVC